MRIFTMNIIIVIIMMLSAAIGGIFIGMKSSNKNFSDIIWILSKN